MHTKFLKERPLVIHHMLLNHYNELGINEQDFVILLKLIYAYDVTNKQPSILTLQQGTTLEEREITATIQKLIQRDLLDLSVHKDDEGKFSEYMNLEGFYEKLSEIMKKDISEDHHKKKEIDFKTLFQQFEQSFSRPLSPIEIETLNQWIDVDQHGNELILQALNEAESNQKLSMKYIDRILLNWKKNNVETIEQSKQVSRAFNQPEMQHKVKKIPKFDWLNGENPYDK
ncbi:DnaD domain-containing protein [Staphylococcus massiliensis]|uniref:DnaD domain-containing protein n=1 Tax=Staphylococcus massiliensis TaxID=555791 RepID=UPI001EE0BA71|nr:DnaD domain-containing protein [Staphylococcus massiliensis]MCG3412246.1 DnaD domain-containing protein [Staphylococcus massiliensis]